MATMRAILTELCSQDVILEDNAGQQYLPVDLLHNDMDIDPALHEEYMESEMSWVDDTLRRIGSDGWIVGGESEWTIKPASEAWDA